MSLTSIKTSPWQLQWKGPVWQQQQPPDCNDGLTAGHSDGSRLGGESRVPVDHCAAAILRSEWQGLESATVGTSVTPETDEEALFLTVTLLRTDEGDAEHSPTNLCADVVEIQVFRSGHVVTGNVEHRHASSSCLYSRTLQWPRSTDDDDHRWTRSRFVRSARSTTTTTTLCQFPLLALFSGAMATRPTHTTLATSAPIAADDNENDASDDDLPTPCFSFLPWLNQRRQRSSLEAERQQERPRRHHPATSGLVAAALVRVPPASQDGDGKMPTEADARDVLQFLSLETPSHDETTNARIGERQSSLHLSDATEALEATSKVATSELLLACLTSQGKVHFYSPWSLMEVATVQNNAVDGMASFLFGESLLTTVQQTQLPLSQPNYTVPLSVPFLQRPDQHRSHVDDSNDEDSSRQRNSHQPMPFLSMFDASMWDPVLDRATLWYQTKDNKPTLCVFAFDYLCVAGCGRQRWDRIINVGPEHTTPRNLVGANDGGFITFISLRTFAEKRTVFVPFVPVQVSPFHWGGLSFVLVAGQDRALAIRVDALAASRIVCDTAPSIREAHGESNDGGGTTESNNMIDIRRFQLIPIDLPSISSSSLIQRIVGCDVLVSPPGLVCLVRDAARGGYTIVERIFRTIDAADNIALDGMSLTESIPPREGQTTAVITTAHTPGHVMKTSFSDSEVEGAWFRLGQGWCIVGSTRQAQFVCFEGSNAERLSAVTELANFDDRSLSPSMATSILPIDPFRIPHQQYDSNARGIFSARQPDVRQICREFDTSFEGDKELLDDVVLSAMESISRLSFRDTGINHSVVSPRKKMVPYTTQEKAAILLDQCVSWTCLERSHRSRSSSVVPVTSFRTRANNHLHLSLRSSAVINGPASSFQEVLTWLSEERDYFTASSVALDLLRDDESLRHLWRSFDKIDRDDECAKLDGLLDGIIPIHHDKRDGTASPALYATLARLADLTACCLVKGGYAMSSTLGQFLSRSSMYDPSDVCILLVATAARVMSQHIDLGRSNKGTKSDDGSDRVLWPVKCLLKVGVARDRLSPALLMLNTTIPDQLRSRDVNSTGSASLSAVDLGKALVSMVVSSSVEATELFLDLVDEKTRLRFWDSLEHEIRLEVSLIAIENKYVLLRDIDVRSWALNELQKCIVNECSASTANIYGVTPSQWLCALIYACFENAGSDLETMLHPKADASKEDLDDSSGLQQYREEVQSMRNAVSPAVGSGGLDFGLLVPALLLLEHRDTLWHTDSETTTRSVLNAVCYLAGHRNQEEPLFRLNSPTLMKQCSLLGDVEAGANLIGGKNGLILECCRVLIDENCLTMDEAENLLLSEDFTLHEVGASNDDNVFVIQSCHRAILWLLEEHVLRIRTYGEFSESRGRVDPVLAAKLFFRTWSTVTQHELLLATQWLTQWLRKRLSLANHQSVSPNRLVCAALIRALLWPEESESGIAKVTPLANLLQIDGVFLVQLSRACCGLVEAVPNFILDGKLVLAADTPSKISIYQSPFNPPSQRHPIEAIDDSFVSAVTSFRDLNTSYGSW